MEPIRFDNEVVDHKDDTVKYLEREGKYLYWHRIYAKEGDIDKIKEVTYILHPTFPKPVRRAWDRKSNFELIIWAWGEFDIKIIITTEDGEEHHQDFSFRFGDKLRKAKMENKHFERCG